MCYHDGMNKWWLVGLAIIVSGCRAEVSEGKQPAVAQWLPALEAEASEGLVDRSRPDWMEEYCKRRVMEVAGVPFEYSRQRGPFTTFDPIFGKERYETAEAVATCNSDFYFWPVNKEAFGQLGVEYAYNQKVWDEFAQVATASVAAKLKNQGWKEVSKREEKGEPDLMLERYDRREKLYEYLDMFWTKDEEVVFEMMVVVEK